MLEQLKNNDIIITNDKKSILKEITENKKILNLRIMTLSEFKKRYYGTYDEKSLYYLINKYHYKYEVAKNYLDNYLFIEDLKKELEENNLIKKEPLFKESIKRIVLLDDEIDPYLLEELKNYDLIKLENNETKNSHIVNKFETIEEEVNFVVKSIIELLKSVNIDKIFIVNVGNEYENILKRTFKFFNIPININVKKSVYATTSVSKFLSILKEKRNIEAALEEIDKDDIYNAIVDVCNKYNFTSTDDVIIYLIEEELKLKKINLNKLDNAVNVIDTDEINNDTNYYFIMNFNQGSIPRIHKDEELLSDEEKRNLKILTSYEKNKLEKEKIKKILSKYENLIITYKTSDKDGKCYKSPIIDELCLEEKEEKVSLLNYSNLNNKICLAKALDELIKYNEKDDNLNLLYKKYKEIPYLSYNNKFTKIDKDDYLKYIDNKILLSYTSLDNYNRCAFKYYVSNVLKLNKFEETFMTFVGNLFHDILSKAFNKDFNFEESFNEFIEKNNKLNLNNKDKFFVEKLKKDLLFTIDTIKKQDKDTDLDNALYEQKIYINKDNDVKVTFMGVIDKLKYNNYDGKTVVAIIDYKTGNPNININNSVYGIEMQLPIYLYLAKNSEFKNVEIAGFYLQKIIHSKLNYDPNKIYEEEKEKQYKLEGYSNIDEDILNKLDKNYCNSNMVKGLKKSSKGFYAYSKVLDKNQIDNLISIAEDKIDETIDNVINAKFEINPKKIGIDNVGCEFCNFKDLCYRKEEDYIYLEEKNYKEFLGGEDNA